MRRPATPAPPPSDTPVAVVVTAAPDATAAAAPTAAPNDTPEPTTTVAPSDTALPSPSAGPTASPQPTATPFKGRAVATRIVIADLRIDLPIVKSPPAGAYPYCNVAMYFGKPLGQPGESRATYIFAHARTGMFGPIYELTMVRRTPNKMVGMLVQVYTSDSKLHTYRIVRVLPHQLTLNRAVGREVGPAVAPDVRGAARDARQDAGAGQPRLRGASRPDGSAPEAAHRPLRLRAGRPPARTSRPG